MTKINATQRVRVSHVSTRTDVFRPVGNGNFQDGVKVLFRESPRKGGGGWQWREQVLINRHLIIKHNLHAVYINVRLDYVRVELIRARVRSLCIKLICIMCPCVYNVMHARVSSAAHQFENFSFPSAPSPASVRLMCFFFVCPNNGCAVVSLRSKNVNTEKKYICKQYNIPFQNIESLVYAWVLQNVIKRRDFSNDCCLYSIRNTDPHNKWNDQKAKNHSNDCK